MNAGILDTPRESVREEVQYAQAGPATGEPAAKPAQDSASGRTPPAPAPSGPMTYLSVCSGIEAATVAWHGLMEPVAFSEIERFASAVLAHHYPSVPNLGDMTKYKGWTLDRSIDLLVGGTPCQSYSVAGLRAGLDDPRGQLMLVYLALARDLRPRWVVWENVPGVLSSHGGRDFGTFLWGLADIGYGWAYRVLDAQYVGVPQRRRRVFVVGYLGDWRVAASVLFEPHSLSGNPPPSREAGARVAPTVGGGPPFSRTGNDQVESEAMIAYPLLGKANPSHDESQDTLIAQCHGSNVGPMGELRRGNGGVTWGVPFVAHALTAQHTASGRMDPNGETFVTHALRADGFDASEDGTGRGTPLVVPFDTTQITSKGNYSNHKAGDPMHPLAKGQHAPAIAASIHPSHEGKQSYAGDGGTINVIARRSSVRRLTPRECERLQGFPDDYTLVTYRRKPAADGPRYRALGNSMAVPVMEWIGRRILDADRAVSHA